MRNDGNGVITLFQKLCSITGLFFGGIGVMGGSMVAPVQQLRIHQGDPSGAAIDAGAEAVRLPEVHGEVDGNVVLGLLQARVITYSQISHYDPPVGVTLPNGTIIFFTLTMPLIEAAKKDVFGAGGSKDRGTDRDRAPYSVEDLDTAARDTRSIAALFGTEFKDGTRMSDTSTKQFTENLAAAIDLANRKPSNVSGSFVTDIAETCVALSEALGRSAKSIDFGKAPHFQALLTLASANAASLRTEASNRAESLAKAILDRLEADPIASRDRNVVGTVASSVRDAAPVMIHRRRSITAYAPSRRLGAVSVDPDEVAAGSAVDESHSVRAATGSTAVTGAMRYLADAAEKVSLSTRDLGLVVQAVNAAEMAAAGMTGLDNTRASRLRSLASTLRVHAAQLAAAASTAARSTAA